MVMKAVMAFVVFVSAAGLLAGQIAITQSEISHEQISKPSSCEVYSSQPPQNVVDQIIDIINGAASAGGCVIENITYFFQLSAIGLFHGDLGVYLTPIFILPSIILLVYISLKLILGVS